MAKPKNKIQKPKTGSAQPAAGSASPFSRALSHFCIFIFAFLLYSNTLSHGFVMDDGAVITNHETVKKGFSGITELFGQSSVYGSTGENFGTYRPITMSLFAMEYAFFGNSPSPYHAVHVLLYSLLCVLIFVLLCSLFKSLPFGNILALASTLLYTAHPLHTEVAANIKSADEILSLMFSAGALLFAIRFSETSLKKFLAGSFLFFLCALFSKESAATFLLIIPVALHFFTPASRKNILTVTGLHVSSVVVYFLARNAALDQGPDGVALINNALAGAPSFSERYATTFVILLHYLKLLFFPHPLSWDYGYNQIPLVGFGSPAAIVSVLIYLALGIFSVLILFKTNISRLKTQDSRLLSFCILSFLISLSVSSNLFVLIGATMAERFLFAPSLAFCILLAFGMIRIFKIPQSNFKLSTLNFKLFPLIIILGLYSYKTYSRNQDWESNLTLFAKGTETCPNSYRTNTTFAWESILAGEKETDKEKKKVHVQNAITYYKKGLAIYDKAEADWYNYGVSSSNMGNIEEAMKSYQRALEINPAHRNSSYNLGTVYMSRKDYPNALKYFSQLYKVDSAFLDVPFKVGLSYQFMEDHRNAIPYYETHFRKYPNDKNVITNLMLAHKALNDPEKTNYYMGLLVHLNKK